MSRSPLDRTTLCNIFLPALVVVALESCYSRGSQYSSPMDFQVHNSHYVRTRVMLVSLHFRSFFLFFSFCIM
jgi:hypothetical protein